MRLAELIPSLSTHSSPVVVVKYVVVELVVTLRSVVRLVVGTELVNISVVVVGRLGMDVVGV